MSFFGDVFSNPLTYIMPAAGVMGAVKSSNDRKLDNQKSFGASAPELLDPNDMGKPEAGGSAYYRMQAQLNGQNAQTGMEKATAGAYGDLAGARSDLASRGGVSSGASERLARAGMGNQASARQMAQGDLNKGNLQAGIADEGMRRNSYNAVRMKNLETQGNIYAGQQQANAALDAAKPKGALGLGFMGL